MSVGQKTKTGRVLQFIRHGADPNLFDPLGQRTVISSAGTYDYAEAPEFQKIKRQGAKALIANARLEEMWQGSAQIDPLYNTIEAQVLQYWIGKAHGTTTTTVGGVNVKDVEYRRYQHMRNDREFFAVQEGTITDCELGGYGMYTGFKWSSKRGNKGQVSLDVNFVTQAAVSYGAMTGSTVQDAVLQIVAANVTASGTFDVSVSGQAAEQVVIGVGDSTATIKAAFEALAKIDGVTVVGSFTAATGELHILTATNSPSSASIYSTITVTPGMTATALQTAIRALGGNYTNVTVTGAPSATGTYTDYAPSATVTSQANVGGAPWSGVTDRGTAWAYCQASHYWSLDLGAVRDLSRLRVTVKSISASCTATVYASDAAGTLQGTVLGTVTGINSVATFSGALSGSARYIKIAFNNSADMQLDEVYVEAANYSGSYNIQFPSAVGNVTDITSTPGTGWSTTVTQPGNSAGTMTVTVTNPTKTPVTIAPTSASVTGGWSASVTQQGSSGVFSVVSAPKPMLPGHFEIYSHANKANLYDAASKLTRLVDWELSDSKIVSPQSHHIKIVDPLRPTLPTTYDSHAEEESDEESLLLNFTLDTDDGTEVSGLLSASRQYISTPRWWGIVGTCPETGYAVTIEFYVSIGASAPRKFAGNVEQRTFTIDLLENTVDGFNFRVIVRTPV